MKKKILAVLIGGVMIMTCLFGCGKSDKKTVAKNDDVTTENTEETTTKESTIDEENETTLVEIQETTDEVSVIPEAGMLIPTGAVYYIASIDTTLVEGIEFPDAPANGDKYIVDGYVYTYYDNFFETNLIGLQDKPEQIGNIDDYEVIAGWNVTIDNCTDVEFNSILDEILGKPVTMMVNTYLGCLELTKSPEIPDSVILMYNTYKYCNKLKEIPKLPEGLKYMWYTFNRCDALTVAGGFPSTVIEMRGAFYYCKMLKVVTDLPQSVEDLEQTFVGCETLNTIPAVPASVRNMTQTFKHNTSLKGWITIDANPEVYTDAFWGVNFKKQSIVLEGSSEILDEIRATSGE